MSTAIDKMTREELINVVTFLTQRLKEQQEMYEMLLTSSKG